MSDLLPDSLVTSAGGTIQKGGNHFQYKRIEVTCHNNKSFGEFSCQIQAYIMPRGERIAQWA